MQRSTAWIIVLASIVAIQAVVIGIILYPPSPQKPGTKVAATTGKPFKLEPVPGTKLKRVTLEPRAAERLGIQTAAVRDQEIVSKRKVPGVVISRAATPAIVSSAASNPAVPASVAEIVVFVPHTRELEGMAQGRPALVVPLGSNKASLLTANLINAASAVASAPEGATKGLYFALDGAEHGLMPGQRVSVEFTMSSSGTKRLVAPYSAVIYDEHGKAWVFTSPAPLTFVRDEIAVDYIDGELAVLSRGPPAGTTIVSVGGMLLLGSEILNK